MAKTTIPAGYFAAGSIATADIADDAVTADKLAANSVVSASIVNGTIATADLADNSITSAKIVNGTIATADLADDAITAAKIDSTATGMTFADLTVDTSTLKVDATNNRVGVGTASPSTPLDVVGSTGIRVNEDGSGTKVINIRSDFAGVDPAINVSTNHGLLFQTNNTERARIASDGAFGIANSNPHFDLDTNEARLGYYSAKGLGYNFFTTSITFSSGTSTKYIAISYTSGIFYNLDLDLHGQYGNFNAEGGIRKVYVGGVNASDTNIYGNANTQLFSLGNTATYYSTGAAAKSGTAKIRIPITGTSLPGADVLHIGIRMFGIHLDRITSIAIE